MNSIEIFRGSDAHAATTPSYCVTNAASNMRQTRLSGYLYHKKLSLASASGNYVSRNTIWNWLKQDAQVMPSQKRCHAVHMVWCRHIARLRRLGAARIFWGAIITGKFTQLTTAVPPLYEWGTKNAARRASNNFFWFVPYLWRSEGTLVANEVKKLSNKFVCGARKQFGGSCPHTTS